MRSLTKTLVTGPIVTGARALVHTWPRAAITQMLITLPIRHLEMDPRMGTTRSTTKMAMAAMKVLQERVTLMATTGVMTLFGRATETMDWET